MSQGSRGSGRRPEEMARNVTKLRTLAEQLGREQHRLSETVKIWAAANVIADEAKALAVQEKVIADATKASAIGAEVFADEAKTATAREDVNADEAKRVAAQATIAQTPTNVPAVEANERFRAFTDALPLPVATLDTHGRLNYVNRQWREYFGPVNSDSSVIDSIYPEDLPLFMRQFAALEGVSDVDCDIRFLRRDRTYRWQRVRIVSCEQNSLAAGERVFTCTDIEECKRLAAEQNVTAARLEQTNRLMLMAGKLACVGLWRYDLRANELFWSEEVYRIFNLPLAFKPTLETAIAAYHPDDRETIAKAVEAAIRRRVAYTIDSRIVRPDGTARDVISAGQPEIDAEGNVTAIFGVLQDVTTIREGERERARLHERATLATEASNVRLQLDLSLGHEALDESERRYVSLAEAMPQIVWTATPEGALDYYNARWYDYSGMTFGQTRGWGWAAVLHPDDVANCVKVWTYALTSGTPFEVEYRFKRASDGAYRWHLGRALPVRDADGSIMKWFGTCTDIDDQKRASEAVGRLTEQLRLNSILERDLAGRKRAEAALQASDELFRQVEDHAPSGLALVALDGSFIRVNPTLCALLGYSRAELLSMTFQVLTHPDDLETDLAHLEQTLKGTIAEYAMEKRYFHKDGSLVWVLLSVSLVRDDARAPSYFIAQILDIGARKAAEAAADRAQAAVLVAMDAKSRFLAAMSHEIRTPMNGIIGMAELLSLSQLSEEQRECVKIVCDSGRSLLRVLNDILDYSKIEAGKLELEITNFELSSQIASLVSLLAPQFTTNGVSMSTQIDPGLPPTVEGDPSRLRQILINLVGNALKFTPHGGTVRLVVAAEPMGQGTAIPVRFAVVDSGVGIAPELQDRLFKPFSQVDGSTTRKHGGTGLGLSICKQLVELMNGQIGVDSAAGKGSSFWFTIPFRRHTGPDRALEAPVREMDERRATERMRSESVLLAEDNEVNALLAIKQFKRLGLSVSVVPNGREAVKALQREHFDIVFMDCHMPELDGLAATREIRDLPSDRARRVPIVAMTADAQVEDQRACLAAGMDDYISKPATLTDLRTALARWLPNATRDLSEIQQ